MIIAMGTDTGRVREINEDAFSVRQISDNCCLMIIADGMGGHNAGETASSTACNIITEKLCTELSDGKFSMDKVFMAMEESIKIANKTLYSNQLADTNLSGMGTTVVAAVVSDNKAYICNVGDSRLYYITDCVKQVTKDHSYVQDLVDKGLITSEEAEGHPNKNIITRAVGTDIDVDVDCFTLDCESGSKILMCTDGLSNFVSEEDMLSILKSYTPSEANKKLIETANNNGGKDNITVINIDFGEV